MELPHPLPVLQQVCGFLRVVLCTTSVRRSTKPDKTRELLRGCLCLHQERSQVLPFPRDGGCHPSSHTIKQCRSGSLLL